MGERKWVDSRTFSNLFGEEGGREEGEKSRMNQLLYGTPFFHFISLNFGLPQSSPADKGGFLAYSFYSISGEIDRRN